MRVGAFDFVRMRRWQRCGAGLPSMQGMSFRTAIIQEKSENRVFRHGAHVVRWLRSLSGTLRDYLKILPIFAASIVLLAPPVIASTPESHERIIRYQDLDLSSPAGIRTLRRRVAAALEAVCGSYAGTESSGGEAEAEEITQCRKKASAEVDKRVAIILGKSARTSAVH